MVKAVDLFGNEYVSQHWLRRFVAAIIDAIIVYVIYMVLLIVLAIFFIRQAFSYGYTIGLYWFLFQFLLGLVWVLYFAVQEGKSGATIGKRVLNIRVASTEGEMNITKGFIRNISKIHGIIFLLDFLVGIFTDGDARQRYFDRIAKTLPVRTDVHEVFPGAFQPRGGPAPPMPVPVPPAQAPGTYPQQPPTQPQPSYAQAGQQPPTQPQPSYAQEGQQPPAQPQPSYAQAGQQPPAQPSPAQTPRVLPKPPDDYEPMPRTEEKAEPIEEPLETYTRSELNNMRKDDLKKIAKKRGLEVEGTKRDLVDRILGEELTD